MNYALDSLTRNTVDYIFSGEAEREFKDFCLNYLKEGVLPSKHLIECAPIPDLDLLPIPDYDEYYGQLYEFGLESNIRRLGFESSRGCWWGEKSNCLFCGLNGIDIHYRQKSLKRICHEIEFLSKKYNVTLLQATDNIMPKDLPEALMQKFSPPSTLNSIYYEVRPTLSFEELYYCKKAGIKTLQPGMESLNNHLLFLLSKGLTASGNIRFLRDCRNLGIRLDWNLLYGIPGEEVKDYEEMLRIIPFISHLAPPDFIGPVNIQRYSPLYMNPKKYGISKIIPHPNYLEIYPDETDFFQFALYFESNFQTVFTGALEREFLAQISFWREKWKQNPPTLRAIKLNEETYLIDDTRSEVNQGIRLISAKYIKILNNFRNPVKRSQFDIDEIQLLKWGYLLKIGEYVVSLVCEPMQVLNYYEKFNKRIQ